MTPTAGHHNGRAIQAVIFDLDGVLMDSEWIAFLVWREMVEERGGRLDESIFPTLIGTLAEETARLVIEASGVSFDIDAACADAWERLLARLTGAIDPLPGSAELVRSLAERGCLLGIASNSPVHYIENALKGLRLEPYFPVRVGVDQVKEGKPAPEVYLRAAERLGVEPSRCMAVEDSRVGVQAASAAGMRVLAVPGERDHRGGFESAWRVVDSLEVVCRSLDDFLAENP